MKIHVEAFLELIKWCTKKIYLGQNGTSIVAVSSVSSIKGAKGLSGYAASKGAINSLIPTLALELAEKMSC